MSEPWNPDAAALPALLIVEPAFVVRRTVAGVARSLQLADMHEATSVESATRMLDARAFDAVYLSLEESAPALRLLERLREGTTRCPRDVPIVVTAAACDAALAIRLKGLQVQRLLLRPFKVKDLLGTIEALRDAAGSLSTPLEVRQD